MPKKRIHPVLKEVIAEIKKAKTCLVAGHTNPEGDAIGSTLALGLGLKKLRKKVKFYNADPVPQLLRFLPSSQEITPVLEPHEHYDLAFIVDVGEKARVGERFANHRGFGKIICIDHHVVGSHEGDINYVLPKAPATGLVVYHLLKALGLKKFKGDIATNLYCAISTDTGSFKYSNTTPETFEVAAELLRSKVDPWEVARYCFETNPLSRLELLKRVLASLEIHPSGLVASISISLKDIEESKATQDLTEGLINYARSVEGVEVAICFRELAPNQYKVSFRSTLRVDVAQLAQKFGGGGHMRAAGCVLEGTLSVIKEKVTREVMKVV